MKRLFIVILLMLICCQNIFAETKDKDYTLKFNKTSYHLLYSIKNNDFGGYLNEYYRLGETYNIWSDIVAIHHFPNAYSPIDRIKDFKEYLSEIHVPSSLTFDDKNNSAMIDFIMITNNQLPVVLEFNIFKYEKSKDCGSLAVQYVKRYTATTAKEIEDIKKEFAHNRTMLIKKVKKFNIPDIITYNIDKCISAEEINSPLKEELTDNKPDKLQETSPETNLLQNDSPESHIIKETEQTESIELNTNVKESCEDNTNLSQFTDNEKNNNEILQTNNNQQGEEAQEDLNTEENQDKILNNDNNPPLKKTKNIKKKKFKEVSYTISNDKQKYIATPRTNKELKTQIKELKKQQKENKSYKVINTNCDLIAIPRTKKDLRKYKKELDHKRKLKERAIKAQKMLEDND